MGPARCFIERTEMARAAPITPRFQKLEGSTPTITRKLDLSPPGPLLLPQNHLAFRTFGQAVLRGLRAQVGY